MRSSHFKAPQQEPAKKESDVKSSAKSSSRPLRGKAFTLLEVIVGLTLMATMLVGSLLAFAAHQRQARFADAKLQAVAVADELLDRFSGSPGGLPPAGRGAIPGKPGWFWQTTPARAIAPAQIPVRIIRFQIFSQKPNGPLTPLVTVELVQSLGVG